MFLLCAPESSPSTKDLRLMHFNRVQWSISMKGLSLFFSLYGSFQMLTDVIYCNALKLSDLKSKIRVFALLQLSKSWLTSLNKKLNSEALFFLKEYQCLNLKSWLSHSRLSLSQGLVIALWVPTVLSKHHVMIEATTLLSSLCPDSACRKPAGCNDPRLEATSLWLPFMGRKSIWLSPPANSYTFPDLLIFPIRYRSRKAKFTKPLQCLQHLYLNTW